jgi:stage II sporulation protein AB (anti-sigma F factor)
MDNILKLQVPALGKNESFCRNVLAAFVVELNPTMEEINDVKLAVSEAVTNVVKHAYTAGGTVDIQAYIIDRTLTVTIADTGCGIADVDEARQPLFTTRAEEEHSGMGFSMMETAMDEVEVVSSVGTGTAVTMSKTFKSEDYAVA